MGYSKRGSYYPDRKNMLKPGEILIASDNKQKQRAEGFQRYRVCKLVQLSARIPLRCDVRMENDVFFVNTQRSGILNFVKTQRGGILRESELVQHARTHTTKKQSKGPILIPHGYKDSTAKPFDLDEFGDDLWDATENAGQKQKRSDDVKNAVTASEAGLISRNVKRDSLDGLPEVF